MKLIAVCVATLAAALALSQGETIDRAALAREMNSLTANDWRPGVGFGQRLAALPGSAGYEILRDNWNKGASVEARKQMFKGFVFSSHPDTVKVLHLGATDPSTDMQNWTFQYLKEIAFIEFAEDYSAYAPWAAKYSDRPFDEVRRENLQRFLNEVAAAKGAEREKLYRKLGGARFGDWEMRSEVALQIVRSIFTSTGASRDAARAASTLLSFSKPDESFLREVVLPGLNSSSTELRLAALQSIAKEPAAWAEEALVSLLIRAVTTPGRMDDDGFSIGQAFAERKDPKHIPLLIGAIVTHNAYDSIYGLGYFGLKELTGVAYDETHDGNWWKAWWEKNRQRFPESVRVLEIPKFEAPPKPDPLTHVPDAEDVADIPTQNRFAGGDKDKRYVLSGPKPGAKQPEAGWKLLVILPGGDGSVEFHPFLKRVLKEALGEEYVIVQLVAKQWSDDQFAKIVWPTKTHTWPGMRFSTEEFIEASIADVGKELKIDPKSVYTMGWSSSGPALYAHLMSSGRSVAGSFIAMSVFWPENLPKVDNVQGFPVYILHSPEDFIKMSHPESAKKALSEAGAKVELQTYAGGHGWHGDVYGLIRRAIEWLERNRYT